MAAKIPRIASRGEEVLAFQLRAVGLKGWVRGYAFASHLGRGYEFDFCWPDEKLAVEVDGAVHRIKGRFGADIERHNLAQLLGWKVLRFSPNDVNSGKALNVIEAVLDDNITLALKRVQNRRKDKV